MRTCLRLGLGFILTPHCGGVDLCGVPGSGGWLPAGAPDPVGSPASCLLPAQAWAGATLSSLSSVCGTAGGGGPRREAGGRGQTTQAVPFYGHTVAGGARTVLTRGAVPEAGTAVCRLHRVEHQELHGPGPGDRSPGDLQGAMWPHGDTTLTLTALSRRCSASYLAPVHGPPKSPNQGPLWDRARRRQRSLVHAHTCAHAHTHTHTRSHALTHT